MYACSAAGVYILAASGYDRIVLSQTGEGARRSIHSERSRLRRSSLRHWTYVVADHKRETKPIRPSMTVDVSHSEKITWLVMLRANV